MLKLNFIIIFGKLITLNIVLSNILKIIILLLFSFSYISYSQSDAKIRNVAECSGNIYIDNPGDYVIQFTGKRGYETNLSVYSSLKDLKLNNTYWINFIAPYDGIFSFTGIGDEGKMDVIVFSKEIPFKSDNSYAKLDICEDVNVGTATIERVLKVSATDSFGLNLKPNDQFLYSLEMEAGKEIIILLNSSVTKRTTVNMKINFDLDDTNIDIDAMKKEVDLRKKYQDFPSITIKTRDKRTGLPVIAKINIKNSKTYNGLYECSDLIFDIQNKEDLKLELDAVGYFFTDKTVKLAEKESKELTIWMEPAVAGTRIELQGIYFKTGSSEFTGGSEDVLLRLRDFLLLNSKVKVEIAGFVNEVGKGSTAGKKMAAARAKRVEKYLINSGIDKKRLKAEGYGNEGMIYPEPKNEWQEQANRRVEIKVL
ncbi:MAG: OmpA family protein [Brumimicrobium sp.]|nr:OmpA family protein [Brumimicrobium sp.]MCO5267328.1 OmpA family protein [Brumimicrobium sp.]